MNKRGVTGSGGKYSYQDSAMSNKRRLMEYRDALEEANIPPSKMRKVIINHLCLMISSEMSIFWLPS